MTVLKRYTGSAWETVGAPSGSSVQVVRKTADESITSTGSLQNDDHLFFSIGANEIWFAEFTIFYDAGTAGDIFFGISLPAGATYRDGVMGLDVGTAADAGNFRTRSLTSGGIGLGGAGTGTVLMVLYKVVITNSSTAGTATLQWAQNSSSGTATKVYANSMLVATKVA